MGDSIVVTGWGMVTPLGFNSEFTWKHLMAGETARHPLGGTEWKDFEDPRAAQVLDAWVPRGLEHRDRSLRWGAIAAEEAWRQAGLSQVDPARIATTFSSSKGGLLTLLLAIEDPMSAGDFLSDFFPHAGGNLLRERLGSRGPALSFSSACSTGIVSIAQGIRLLQDGECDAVLTGSTESSIHPLIYAGFRNMGVLSERAEGSAPFDLDRDGFVMGEGAAVMVLEREETARKRLAPLLARVSGWALGADAYAPLEMEPEGKTILPVIRKALQKAGLKPEDIGYINAHGTGTKLNDTIESKALFEVFGDRKTWVSSTKSATGHLLGAAGSVEAVLTAMALSQGELPDTRNLTHPDPECRVRHVEKGGVRQKIEHALSLSYGFGGQLGAVIFSKV